MNLRKFIIVLAVIGIIVFVYILATRNEDKQVSLVNNHKNAEYVINGNRIKLVDSVAETEAAPGSASKVVTRYFGNELLTDLNNDGREDVVFILTNTSGGSGTSYHVVAALSTESGYVGSESFVIGDRIAPQTIEKGKGNIIVFNYADRAPGEPFTTAPSVGKTVWLILDIKTMQFGTVEQNFEGEADPVKMSLGMKAWTWVSTSTKPFSITFAKDGKFSLVTDCNRVGGSYTTNKNTLTFSQIFSTEMYCADSRETEFVGLLEKTEKYHFTGRGELVLGLKAGGEVVFK